MRRNAGVRLPEPRMAPATFVILHSAGFEITLLEYLSRVVLYLFAFGGVAAIVFWGTDAVRAVRSGVVERWGGGENDP